MAILQPFSTDHCPKLNYPQNGVVQVTGVKPGDKATYKCETGYILVGYSTLTCQQYGTWSSHPPTCKRKSVEKYI